ncbi:F-box domain-containing protein [Mycena indigotica]|uniref:F-box domain-containing protein n=1 Tax=Mycena indigotica TaxID=2126181 RepID=A0A8H6S0P0_9AGAR|nr:F-box domain-containing protein [Mycena indigotica]KAF7290168.1 F-box domain-containing protein [Mycena indigotica]
MAADPAFDLPDTIAEIDIRLKQLYAEVTALQSKRNTLVPLSALPNELLCRIIDEYARQTDSLYDLRWTRVMMVCRRWCEVVRAEQKLWAYIDTNHGRTISGSVYEDVLRMQHLLGSYSARIASLEFDGVASNVLDIINLLPHLSLTSLHSLTIGGHYKQEELPQGRRMAIPDILLDGHLPNLRILSLSYVALAWNHIGGLEELKLEDCANTASDVPPSVGDVLRLAAASPHLSKLSFTPQEPLLPISDAETVNLPRMKYIYLLADILPITMLINDLKFPSTTVIDLVPLVIENGFDIRDIIIPLRHHLRAANGPNLQKLSLFAYFRDEDDAAAGLVCNVELYRAPESRTAIHTPFLSLNTHPKNERCLRQIVTKFLHAALAGAITQIDAGAQCLSEASWRAILQLLPGLRFVRVWASETSHSTRTMEGLCAALCKLSDNAPPLYTVQVDIIRSYERDQQDDGGIWLVDALSVLYAYVKLRRASFDMTRANPLRRLVFRDDGGLLYSTIHKGVMEQLFKAMDAMGVVQRGEYEWNPVLERRERNKNREFLRTTQAGMALAIEVDSDEPESEDEAET